MKTIKINSSVVKFNVGVVLVSFGLWLTGFLTSNPNLINDVVGQNNAALVMGLIGVITTILRTTNLQGKPPVEVIDTNDNPETPTEQ